MRSTCGQDWRSWQGLAFLYRAMPIHFLSAGIKANLFIIPRDSVFETQVSSSYGTAASNEREPLDAKRAAAEAEPVSTRALDHWTLMMTFGQAGRILRQAARPIYILRNYSQERIISTCPMVVYTPDSVVFRCWGFIPVWGHPNLDSRYICTCELRYI